MSRRYISKAGSTIVAGDSIIAAVGEVSAVVAVEGIPVAEAMSAAGSLFNGVCPGLMPSMKLLAHHALPKWINRLAAKNPITLLAPKSP